MIGLSWRAGLQAPESSLSFGWPFSLSLSLPPKVLLQGTLASGTLFFFLRSRRWVHFTFLGKPFYFLFSFRLAIYSLLDLGSCSTVPFRRVDRSLTRQSLIPVYWTWPIVQRDTETAAQQGWNNPALLTETKPESLSMVNKYGKSLFFVLSICCRIQTSGFGIMPNRLPGLQSFSFPLCTCPSLALCFFPNRPSA